VQVLISWCHHLRRCTSWWEMPAMMRHSRCAWPPFSVAKQRPSWHPQALANPGPSMSITISTWRVAAAQCGLIDRRLDDGKLVCALQQISTNSTEGAQHCQTCNACRACHRLPCLSLPPVLACSRQLASSVMLRCLAQGIISRARATPSRTVRSAALPMLGGLLHVSCFRFLLLLLRPCGPACV